MTQKHPKILLIGDKKMLCESAGLLDQIGTHYAADMEQAKSMATANSYEVLLVNLSSLSAGIECDLKLMCDQNINSRLIFISRMYDEPFVIRLINSPELAEANCEYHVLPINPQELKQILLGKEEVAPAQSSLDSTNKDFRIRQLEKLATEDELTGIKNRRYVREFLRQIIEKSTKEQMQVTLLIFDIDDFKHYNDTYGHKVGDDILRQAAQLMQKCCRAQDVAGRIGGDEFAVVFWDSTAYSSKSNDDRRAAASKHPTEALHIAKRYLRIINEAEFTVLGKHGKGNLSVSGGLATYPVHGKNVEELFVKADEALLDAKRKGKNRIFIVGGPDNK